MIPTRYTSWEISEYFEALVLQHQGHAFEDENVTRNLEKVWSPHLADQKMLPKISIVSKAELERREDQEKVSTLLYATETYTNLEISPKRSPSRPRTTQIAPPTLEMPISRGFVIQVCSSYSACRYWRRLFWISTCNEEEAAIAVAEETYRGCWLCADNWIGGCHWE